MKTQLKQLIQKWREEPCISAIDCAFELEELLNEHEPNQTLQEQVDAIWNLAHKSSRARSSRKQLMDKWKLHRKYAMSFELVLKSLRDWNSSKQWAEGYAEGIHRWVQNHRWEVEPEPAQAQAPKSRGLTSFDVGI